MLNLDDMREAFARHLADDPRGRWRMDAALAYVATLAYTAGLNDAGADTSGDAMTLRQLQLERSILIDALQAVAERREAWPLVAKYALMKVGAETC